MNCTCENPTIVEVLGVERCVACGKCTGASAFVSSWESLPSRALRRKNVGFFVNQGPEVENVP